MQTLSQNPTRPAATNPVNADQVIEHYLAQGDDQSLALDLMACASGMSKAQLKNYAQMGAMWLSIPGRKTERIRRLKRVLKLGETLDFYFNPQVLNAPIPTARLILDKKSYSIWLKPRAMLSQGSKWGDFSALYRFSETYFAAKGSQRQSWIAHRLDKATCGLMIVPHTKSAARYFSNEFEQGRIHKQYQANVLGNFADFIRPDDVANLEFAELLYAHNLAHNPTHKTSKVRITLPIDEQASLTDIQLVEYCPAKNLSRLDIRLHTGRKHQIRKHLAYLNTPIIGDRFYGDEAWLASELAEIANADLQLTAYQLTWTCPVDKCWHQLTLPENDLQLLTCAASQHSQE